MPRDHEMEEEEEEEYTVEKVIDKRVGRNGEFLTKNFPRFPEFSVPFSLEIKGWFRDLSSDINCLKLYQKFSG